MSLWVSVCVSVGVCRVSMEGVAVYVSVDMCVSECVLSLCVCLWMSLSVYANGCVCAGATVSVSGSRYLWPV